MATSTTQVQPTTLPDRYRVTSQPGALATASAPQNAQSRWNAFFASQGRSLPQIQRPTMPQLSSPTGGLPGQLGGLPQPGNRMSPLDFRTQMEAMRGGSQMSPQAQPNMPQLSGLAGAFQNLGRNALAAQQPAQAPQMPTQRPQIQQPMGSNFFRTRYGAR